MFGVVKGSRVAVVVDTSEANTNFGRLTSFQESLGVCWLCHYDLITTYSYTMFYMCTTYTSLQQSHKLFLQHLLDEQLSKKKGIYLCQFGTEVYPLWPHVMDVNCRTYVSLVKYYLHVHNFGFLCLLHNSCYYYVQIECKRHPVRRFINVSLTYRVELQNCEYL